MAAGYLLGRFKKLRMALVVGSALASEDVRKQGATLLKHGPLGAAEPIAKKAGKTLSSQLLEAGKSAAVGAAGSRIGSLTDRLNERATALQGNGASKGEPEDEYDEPEDEYDEPVDEEAEEDEPVDEEAEDDQPEDEPEDEYDEEPPEDEDLAEEPEDEEPPPKKRSPRRRRTTSPAGR